MTTTTMQGPFILYDPPYLLMYEVAAAEDPVIAALTAEQRGALMYLCRWASRSYHLDGRLPRGIEAILPTFVGNGRAVLRDLKAVGLLKQTRTGWRIPADVARAATPDERERAR